jgi:hypothetical protein
VACEALTHLHQLAVDIAQTLGDVDQTEWDQDRDLDEDNTEVSGLEPDCRKNGPTDRGKRIEHRLDPFIDHAVEPRHAMGEERQPAADQQRCRDRDQDPPSGREHVPQEFRRHEQLDQASRHRNRPRQDEFRQAAS